MAVLDQTRMKALPVLNRAADFVPAAQACCGACRTCMTTNLFSLAAAGLAGAGVYVTRLLRRSKPA
ncbi:MAG: hypothetical protein QOE38_69 [Thermoleophilaceae bacterium]|nr:hypothetical protein [Thermoleophilaceae bacterium]